MSDDTTSHERREQLRKEREESFHKKQEKKEERTRKKDLISLIAVLCTFVLFAVLVFYFINHRPKMYTDRDIHWHVLVDLELCGVHQDLPRAKPNQIAHGEPFIGTYLMHTHDDNTIHIEGIIAKKEDIALGKFFESIEIPFDYNKIMNYTNGDLCDGKPGVLKMYVNGQPREDFRDYIPFATPDSTKQVLKLVFAPEENPSAPLPKNSS